MKEILDYLYFISLGVWATCLFITACYDNSIPMWISLVVMTTLNFARQGYSRYK